MGLNSMSLNSFKAAINTSKLEVLQNPKTDKWFAVDDSGNKYRCHQGTDWATKPRNVAVLVEDGDLTSACLIPIGIGVKVAATY